MSLFSKFDLSFRLYDQSDLRLFLIRTKSSGLIGWKTSGEVSARNYLSAWRTAASVLLVYVNYCSESEYSDYFAKQQQTTIFSILSTYQTMAFQMSFKSNF